MGFFRGLKKLTWKKVGKGIGKVVDNKLVKGAAALGLGATGFGAPAAALLVGGMSAGGKLAQGKRLTTALKGGAIDGGLTYVGGKVAGKIAPKVGGIFKGGENAPIDFSGLDAGRAAVDKAVAGSSFLNGGAGNTLADAGRFRSIASSAGKFFGGKDGFGGDDLLKYGKAGADALGAYSGAKNMDRYRQIAEQDYAEGAPLRAAARQQLLGLTQQPIQSTASMEPEPRYRRVSVGSRV